MTKNTIKKFRKNDFSYEDEDRYDTRSYYLEKKKAKRVDRALKTKDIYGLIEDHEEQENDYNSQQDYKNSMRAD
jgi:hypothetical protein